MILHWNVRGVVYSVILLVSIFGVTVIYLSSISDSAQLYALRSEIQRLEEKLPYMRTDSQFSHFYAITAPLDKLGSERTAITRVVLPEEKQKLSLTAYAADSNEKWHLADSVDVPWRGPTWIRWSWTSIEKEVHIIASTADQTEEFRI